MNVSSESECIFRECKKCGASKLKQYLLDQNPDMKWDKTVQWHQWEEVQDKDSKKIDYDRRLYVSTLTELVILFVETVTMMSWHLFNFK